MKDKILISTSILVALLMLSMTVAPSLAFVYPDGSDDDEFEIYGPHIDRILVKKYAGLDPEMQALQAGEIDITDWALTKTWKDTFATDPNVRVMDFGGEAGYYTLNFNHNNNPFLGNPEDPAYVNPVYPNPCSVISLRQALSHLIDRVLLCQLEGEGLYDPIFTPIPSYMKYWIHPDIKYGGALAPIAYPPSIPDAAAKLTADGFLMGGPGGKRFWDHAPQNGVYDGAAEDLNLVIYSRADKLRKGGADRLCAGLDDPAIQVAYTRYEVTGGQAWQVVMVEKNYHMYTAGWIYIGPDPDYLFDLYNYDNYYHPEDPPNFGAIGKYDPLLQLYSSGLKYATTVAIALQNCRDFQEEFAATACEVPLASTAAPKAHSLYYTGGNDGVPLGDAEDMYRGKWWTDIVNETGIGINSFYTTLNAYPIAIAHLVAPTNPLDTLLEVTTTVGFKVCSWAVINPEQPTEEWFHIDGLVGPTTLHTDSVLIHPHFPGELIEEPEIWGNGGDMTMRYGWKEVDMPQTLNPMYSSWYWESELYGRVYDGLGGRNPHTKGPMQVPFLADNWTVGTWVDPRDGLTKATVTVSIRPDVLWSDGHPLDIEDVIWTFIDMPAALRAKGCPDVWWQPTLDQIAGFYRLDKYSIKVLMRVNAVWAMNWIVGNIVVPKHIWQPYIPTHSVAEISGDFSDQPGMLVGTGAFLYIENTPNTALMIRNPLFWQTWDKCINMYYGDEAKGIQVYALPPSTQISPYKIKADPVTNKGYVMKAVWIKNLDERHKEDFHKKVELVYPNGTVELLAEAFNVTLGPSAYYVEMFGPEVLPPGKYTIRVTLWITSGYNYEWFKAHGYDPAHFLGPYTVEKNFWVTVPADLNEDGKVDIFDIVPIAIAFGSRIGDPNYNPQADLNQDGKIDIFDIVIVAISFGWAW